MKKHNTNNMKKLQLLIIALAMTMSLMTVSCQKEPEPVNNEPTPATGLLNSYVETLEGVTLLSDETHSLSEVMGNVSTCGLFDPNSPLVSYFNALMGEQMNDTLAAWNTRYGMSATNVKVRCLKYLYRTIDHLGRPITLSSYATWAYPDIEDPQSKVILNRIILFCPYSQTKEAYCATATNGGAANALLTKDALIVTPDPQGFGNDSGHDQMYMNHELIGRQMADAVGAAYKVFLQLGFRLQENFYLTPMGMSQGASSAVSTHRYLERTDLTITDASGTERHTLADWWHLRYTSGACGPYSPETTLNDYLAWQTFAHPAVLPLVFKTYLQSYPDIFGTYTEDDFYSDRYLTHKSFFDSAYLFKPYTIIELNELLFERVSSPENHAADTASMVLTDMLSPEVLESSHPLEQRLRQALQRNDLTSGWMPQHPIYLYASDADDYVPYSNTQALVSMAPAKIQLLETDHNEHLNSCGFWLLKMFTGVFDTQIGN